MSGNDAQKKHRRLICALEDKVRDQYSVVMREVQVRDVETGRVVGEIDLVGIVDGRWDLYEVKVTDNPNKARSQLKNLQGYLQDNGDLRLYYYSGKNKTLTEIK